MPEGWILAMMGEGHLRDELIEIADGINAEIGEARVRFIPSVPQAELIYWTAGATLGAIPYENVAANHWFCTPNKLWEYPAAGVPFIAPRLHEISRVVDEYGTGFLFPADFDAKTISDLIAALDDAALAEKRANIARFIDECSWEVFAPRLIALYRGIANDLAASKVIPFETQAVAAPPITAHDRKAS
jgi:glycosyltransferase involved in cell wall biosynthesis